MDIGRGRSTMNVALWVVQGLLAALSRQLSTKQPSRKEETMSTGGFSKARLGRMHDVMGFFCDYTGFVRRAPPRGSRPRSSRPIVSLDETVGDRDYPVVLVR